MTAMPAAEKSSSPTADSWRALYPSCEAEIHIDGLRYHYLDTAVETSAVPPGPVILCVHGNPTWSFYWRNVIQRLGDRVRVIAVDHIGCGLSDKPPRDRFAYSLAAHRDNLLRLVDHLELHDIILLAHDWGGPIGLTAAAERIERMAGVMLLNTAAFPPPYIPWRIAACRTPWLGSHAMLRWNAFARAALTMAMNKSRLTPAVAAGLIHPYGSPQERVGIDAFVRDIPFSRRHPTHAVLERLEADLSKFAPLSKLLVWGMMDWCFRPECLERLIGHWPDAEVVRLDDAGHYVLEDDPEATLAAIEQFVDRLLARRSGEDA